MFFDLLNQKELSAVEKIGMTRKFAAGDTIYKEGVAGSSFCIILEGKVEVRKSLRYGQMKALVELGPLDIFGELGFFGVASRSASVVAVTDVSVIEFHQPDFEELVEQKPAIGAKVYKGMAQVLAQRLSTSDESLMDTIIWALGQAINKPSALQINIAARPRLSIRGALDGSATPAAPTSG